MNKKSGFTLIEVLTVIMIIAILASVVLVSLQSARDRTRDVTIQNQIGQLRSLAEALYTFDAGYEDFRESDHPDNDKYLLVKGKIAEMGGDLQVELDGHEYCAYSNLARNENEYFCVDSTGDALTSESIVCDSSDLFCRGEVAECTVDGDCGMGEVCDDGVCVVE